MPDLVALTGIVLCSCGTRMEKISTKYKCQYYLCPSCRRTAATHPDGSLMSTPADGELRSLRRGVHKLLDRKFLDKRQQYAWLRRWAKEEHVGFLDKEECRRIQDLLKGQGTLEL